MPQDAKAGEQSRMVGGPKLSRHAGMALNERDRNPP